MDYITLYKCIDCSTNRYLIFPNRNESFIICSGCYRQRKILEEEEEEEKEKKEVLLCIL